MEHEEIHSGQIQISEGEPFHRSQHQRRILMKSLALCAVLVLLYSVNSASQTVQDNLYVTNGGVNAILVNGNTIYIGGSFTQVGPSTGYGAAVDSATNSTYDQALPKVRGTINAVIPDGSGGWYIGGSFAYVGTTPRNNIAHIKLDKTVDATWDPNADGTVYSLALSGATVYAGGSFINIGGLPRNRIAAIDASGAATTWNPNAGDIVRA